MYKIIENNRYPKYKPYLAGNLKTNANMKITQLRGDLAAFRNLELSIVLNAMKTENSRKPVTTLRQNIPYLTPGIKALQQKRYL